MQGILKNEISFKYFLHNVAVSYKSLEAFTISTSFKKSKVVVLVVSIAGCNIVQAPHQPGLKLCKLHNMDQCNSGM